MPNNFANLLFSLSHSPSLIPAHVVFCVRLDSLLSLHYSLPLAINLWVALDLRLLLYSVARTLPSLSLNSTRRSGTQLTRICVV